MNAMLARLSSGREVSLAPASFAEHAAKTSPGIAVRDVVDPPITAELSFCGPRTTLHPPSRPSSTPPDDALNATNGYATP